MVYCTYLLTSFGRSLLPYSCTDSSIQSLSWLILRFEFFQFSDLLWNLDGVSINSWILLECKIKQEQILNLALYGKTKLDLLWHMVFIQQQKVNFHNRASVLLAFWQTWSLMEISLIKIYIMCTHKHITHTCFITDIALEILSSSSEFRYIELFLISWFVLKPTTRNWNMIFKKPI